MRSRSRARKKICKKIKNNDKCKKKQEVKMHLGKWIDSLYTNIGCYLDLETTDGVKREGKLTSISFRQFTLNKKLVNIPDEIEINGDPSDKIPISRIMNLNIDFPKD